jgi:hypothetical protein
MYPGKKFLKRSARSSRMIMSLFRARQRPGIPREVELRSPGRWLSSIHRPTFVFEGTQHGNLASLQVMALATNNPMVHFLPVQGANHLSVLAPTNALIARRIVGDTGPTTNIAFTERELNQPFGR